MRIWINKRTGEGEIIAECTDLRLIEIIPGGEGYEDNSHFFMGIIVIDGVEHDLNLELTPADMTKS